MLVVLVVNLADDTDHTMKRKAENDVNITQFKITMQEIFCILTFRLESEIQEVLVHVHEKGDYRRVDKVPSKRYHRRHNYAAEEDPLGRNSSSSTSYHVLVREMNYWQYQSPYVKLGETKQKPYS